MEDSGEEDGTAKAIWINLMAEYDEYANWFMNLHANSRIAYGKFTDSLWDIWSIIPWIFKGVGIPVIRDYKSRIKIQENPPCVCIAAQL